MQLSQPILFYFILSHTYSILALSFKTLYYMTRLHLHLDLLFPSPFFSLRPITHFLFIFMAFAFCSSYKSQSSICLAITMGIEYHYL